MGLKRFDNKLPGQRKNFKQIAIVLCICLIAVLSFTSYALYEVRHPKDLVNSKVGEFNTSDVSLAILVDGVKADAFPAKDSGEVFEKLECTNGGSASWDSDAWKLTINDITGPTECTISFTNPPKAVDKLTELAKTNTSELFTDDTVDKNIRYMGANPANYVDIGNGNDADGNLILWRIIGVMNNVDDGTGDKETRIKIIRENEIGKIAWDNKCTGTYDETAGTCSVYGSYKNNWETSSLNKTLNEVFYNSAKTTDANYANITGSFKWQKLDYSTNGLGSVDKNLIGTAVYHLGGPTSSNYQTLTASGYYNAERSNSVYSGNPETWIGKVGLMYPSDYGYAASGGSTKNKEACNAKELYNWSTSDYTDCKNHNWLHSNTVAQWAMTPYKTQSNGASYVYTDGHVSGVNGVGGASGVRPVLYLKSDVKIMGGDGTKSSPYKIGL